MQFQRFETPGIAHYAYLLADRGDALIVDPRRDVDEYIHAARARGVRIRWILETHRQEDFVMGSTHLAMRTGAAIVNGTHELFGHGDIRLADGDTLRIGGLRLRALHTPGHTPESTCYAIYASPEDRHAWGVFTGDTLFYGETGRTDLADADRTWQNAALLHDMVHARLADLGERTLIWPAHGPGSVCGSGMASLPMSTLGAERSYNPVFVLSRASFADEKARQRLPRPPYFSHMEQVNLHGGIPPAMAPVDVLRLSVDEVDEHRPECTLIDTRAPEAFAGGHIGGSYAIWLDGLPAFGGWVARHDTPLLLVSDRDRDIDRACIHLGRIGIDCIQGALAGGFSSWRASGRPIQTAGVITPPAVAARRDDLVVLDVRDAEEFEQGHIEGARHRYVGHLVEGVGGLHLERSACLAVTCSVGNRSGLAVSILLRNGFETMYNMLGGMTAWNALELPRQGRR